MLQKLYLERENNMICIQKCDLNVESKKRKLFYNIKSVMIYSYKITCAISSQIRDEIYIFQEINYCKNGTSVQQINHIKDVMLDSYDFDNF